jgi:hypothetical protein
MKVTPLSKLNALLATKSKDELIEQFDYLTSAKRPKLCASSRLLSAIRTKRLGTLLRSMDVAQFNHLIKQMEENGTV